MCLVYFLITDSESSNKKADSLHPHSVSEDRLLGHMKSTNSNFGNRRNGKAARQTLNGHNITAAPSRDTKAGIARKRETNHLPTNNTLAPVFPK